MKHFLLLCFFLTTSLLKLNSQIDVSITSSVNPICFHDENGKVILSITNAQGEVSIFIDTPLGIGGMPQNIIVSGDTLSHLIAGDYMVTVSDTLTSDTLLFTLTEPDPLLPNVMPANFNCLSVCNGQILTSVTGGTAPYLYTWSPAVSTIEYAMDLCAGDYSVTVADINGCSTTETITTVVVPDLSVSLTQTNTTCTNACDGKISANINGGLLPYLYLWDTGTQAAPDITRLCPGFYKLTVMDASGCSVSDSTNVSMGTNDLNNVTASFTVTNESCLNSEDGSVSMTTDGTNPGPFTYLWSNGATTPNMISLTSNNYDVIIYDASMNCTTAATFVAVSGVNCGSISGKVFTDYNADCLNDTTEDASQNAMVLVNPGNKIGYTNTNGEYSINNLPFNTYTVTLLNSLGNISPGCSSVFTPVLNTTDTISTDNNFATIFNTASQPDVQVSAWDNGIVPGFDKKAFFYLQSYNMIPATGIFKATLPSAFTASITSITPGNYTQSGDTIMWNFTNLTYLQSILFTVDFTVPVSTTLGSNFISCAIAVTDIPDMNQGNNYYCNSSLITGSMDPNERAVNPPGVGPTGDILPNETNMTYLTRFQNTGNGPAVNIVVRDTLSPNLDLSTFEIIKASHNYSIEILPGNILKWKFNNIMLADSTSDEEASHGYIQYKIKRNGNNTPGTQIKSTAYIYFDFNEPVATNTALNTIVLPTGINNQKDEDTNWKIYPNPTNGLLYLTNNIMLTNKNDIEVTNAIGQIVYTDSFNGSTKTVDLNKFDNGIYFIKISSAKGSSVKRIVLNK